MKKLLILPIGMACLFLFSFSILPIKAINYKVTCGSGATYYFQCDCGLESASQIGSLICRMPISE